MEKKSETKIMKNSQYRIEYYPDKLFCFSPIADEATCICAAWGDFLTHDGYGQTGRSSFWRPYILKWKNAVAGWLNNEYPDLRGYLGFFPSYPINLEPCDHTFVIARLPQNLT